MYGVVVCPRCRRAKGVRATQRTTACSCGATIPVRRSSLRARVDRVTELPAAVRTVATAVAGGEREYAAMAKPPKRRSAQVHVRVAAAVGAGDRRAKVLAAARGLTAEVIVFTREDFARVLSLLGLGDADAALESLRRENLLVEPRPGYFRVITA